jgi:dienelactone hydrolase
MRRRDAGVALRLWVGAALLGGCLTLPSSLSITTTAPNGALEHIPVTLYKPDGHGPFPAVVILHDCSGLGNDSSGAPDRWARELVNRGYVALVPDSFSTRGFAKGVCFDPSPRKNEVSPQRRVRDTYAALAYLRSLAYVDGGHVGLMGGSHGASTTLASLVAPESDTEPLARERTAGYAAGVALYPGCGARFGTWRGSSGVYHPVVPVLILIGEKDDWTPAEPCRKLAEAAQAAGYPVALRVYPGAYHSFDGYKPVRYEQTRVNPNSPSGFGATTGGDPKAWADSIREVAAFFGRHLK